MTEKTQRPPGRSTRATSAISPALSATNGIAPYAEQARSKDASANGSRQASAWATGTRVPVERSSRRPYASCACETSIPYASAPCSMSQRAHWAAPQPTSRTRAPPHLAEQPRVGLAQALGAPDEVRVAQEAPVLGLVGGRVGVPPATAGGRDARGLRQGRPAHPARAPGDPQLTLSPGQT